MTQPEFKPPDYIWLQFYGDQGPPADVDPVEYGEVSWSMNKIYEHDTGYMRVDSCLRLLDNELATTEYTRYHLKRVQDELRTADERMRMQLVWCAFAGPFLAAAGYLVGRIIGAIS